MLSIVRFDCSTQINNIQEMKKIIMALAGAAVLASCETTTSPGIDHVQEPSIEVKMAIDEESVNSLTVETTEDSTWIITITDGDPYLFLKPLEMDVPAENKAFAFEYKAENTIDKTQVFFADENQEVDIINSVFGKSAPATDEWSPYSIRLTKQLKASGWGKKGETMRLDLGESIVKGNKIQIRNIVMRTLNAEEQAEEDAENAAVADKEAYEQGIKDYLATDWQSGITSVSVLADKVEITGTVSGEGQFFLAEIPLFEDIFSMDKVPQEYRHDITGTSFDVTLDRSVVYGASEGSAGAGYDRLLSKWAVFRPGQDSDELVSSAVYAGDNIASKGPGLPRIDLAGNKKGLGGIVNNALLETDIVDLGLKSATINIIPALFINTVQTGSYTTAYEYEGTTYYIDENYLSSNIDNPVQVASKYGVSVAGIILMQLTGNEISNLFRHPDYTDGVYSMPNMTTPEAVNAYAAAMEYLADRYSKESMRISHWIVHNEVDGGSHWTNMGADVLVATYMDTYVKSMRLVYNIAHQYDSNSQVFVSLSHGWTEEAGGGWYKVVDILDLLNGFSKAEGDFYWAPAYHSYGSSLSDPDVWEDDKAQFSMDTPYVTMKNLEVLDKWVKTTENMYKGTSMRKVWLSEAGVGSGVPDDVKDGVYPEDKLALQAAGFAYCWIKINGLEGIEALQWHNWMDNQSEGALLGLRKYGDTHQAEPKPVWTTYQKAGTSEESTYFESEGYKATVGDAWGIQEVL